jgi:DivIVA domain-containing protein
VTRPGPACGPERLTILTAVDRDAIERRDFPVGRRGYDQAAVDDHLRRVADELDALKARRATPASGSPFSAGTSEQVRLILEAAEASAAELRADAGRQAGDHVGRVEQAAGGMLTRLDELERELGTLLDALRLSGERLSEGLAKLHEQVGEASGAADETPSHEELVADDEVPSIEDLLAAGEPPAAEPPPAAQPPPADGDEAGARLIALNMALSGTPREETARYLAEHFALADPDALLDDVYARAGQ